MGIPVSLSFLCCATRHPYTTIHCPTSPFPACLLVTAYCPTLSNPPYPRQLGISRDLVLGLQVFGTNKKVEPTRAYLHRPCCHLPLTQYEMRARFLLFVHFLFFFSLAAATTPRHLLVEIALALPQSSAPWSLNVPINANQALPKDWHSCLFWLQEHE